MYIRIFLCYSANFSFIIPKNCMRRLNGWTSVQFQDYARGSTAFCGPLSWHDTQKDRWTMYVCWCHQSANGKCCMLLPLLHGLWTLFIWFARNLLLLDNRAKGNYWFVLHFHCVNIQLKWIGCIRWRHFQTISFMKDWGTCRMEYTERHVRFDLPRSSANKLCDETRYIQPIYACD